MITRRAFFGAGMGAFAAFAAQGSGRAGDGVPASGGARKEIPAGEFDVCVLGGSCTGVFAAVRAAERGMRVALVENNGFFGGTATAGFVPIWHSLYDTAGEKKIIGGLTEEIQSRLLARREAVLEKRGNPSAGVYLNTSALTLALDDLVSRHGTIRPFLHARVVDAKLSGAGRATHAVIEDKTGRRLIAAKFFVDATGDADFIRRAGLGVWRRKRADLQAHTTCALLSGVDAARRAYGRFDLSRILRGKGGAGLEHGFGWTAKVIGCPSLDFIAATRVKDCDPSDADDLTRGEIEARRQIAAIVDAANRMYPPKKGGPGIAIAAIAPAMGLRESCHIDALYRVTADDVLRGRRFGDAIARGSYRVDIHEGTGITFRYLDGTEVRTTARPDGSMKHVKGRWLPKGEKTATWYEIPYRALVPKGSENIIAAGRMIDCERDAYGALRVMVNCNQMGEAAGLAAARAVEGRLSAADACVPAAPV